MPNMNKQQLVELAATFFGKGPGGAAPHPEQSIQKLRELFQSAKDISLTLTTRCEGKR